MKASRALSRYLIRDLAKFSNQTFKFQDRLTRSEVEKLSAWARSNPDVVKAYTSQAHPDHGAVRLYADLVKHYAVEHPQTGSGEPEAWPDPGKSERAIGANPYGVSTAEEAEAFLAWVQTTPEYRAGYVDGNHPHHAALVAQTQELMAFASTAATAAAGGVVDRGPQMVALEQIKAMQKEPAYLDKGHPDHKAAVEGMSRAYAAAYPEPAGAARQLAGADLAPLAAARVIPATEPADPARHAALQRIKEMQKGAAYLDKRHPDHRTAVEAMSQVFAQAYPEPSPAAGPPQAASAAPAPAPA